MLAALAWLAVWVWEPAAPWQESVRRLVPVLLLRCAASCDLLPSAPRRRHRSPRRWAGGLGCACAGSLVLPVRLLPPQAPPP
eukprot:3397199-Pleurochrysis_carterae.AAC.1